MVLADTSVWIAHFRKREPKLAALLSEGAILMHPWIRGELACGNLSDRGAILADLAALPAAKVASDSEVLFAVEDRKLWGSGLGWVDVQLLVSALLTDCQLWSLDGKLANAAKEFGIS